MLKNESATAHPIPAFCPVCLAPRPQRFLSVNGQDYWQCLTCVARFLDPNQHPSREVEYAQYRTHENNPDDSGYRKFLSKLVDPLITRLSEGSSGLDYGCGPGPALAIMLRESGYVMELFDPFFYPDRTLLNYSYDFVTCTEVVEHFHHPAEEFHRLMRMVKPGGWLAIMTCFQTDDEKFKNWHYRRDPTHVVFYREETLRHLAEYSGWLFERPVKNVALMQRPIGDCPHANND